MRTYIVIAATVFALNGVDARAWGSAGHQTVGAIADQLLAGTHAGKKVKQLLGTETLRTAALWADCAKGATEHAPFHYVVNPRFSECAPFQTAAGQKEMVNFVKRNLDTCHPAPGEEKCHRQYHYADVAIERSAYVRGEVGTSDHDIVSAIDAAVRVLQGRTAPAPFSFGSKKEALRALAHYLGDVHQPLHVGAIYLDAAGHQVDPDTTGLDPATQNRGGNLLLDGARKLHGEWDDIPTPLTVGKFRNAGVVLAKQVAVTAGPVSGWPIAWATETVLASHAAFQGLSFGPEDGVKTTWPVTEPAGYAATRAALQKDQLVKAGARLAQILTTIWP